MERRGRERPSVGALSLRELAEVGVLLGGGSVIDWHRLNFTRAQEVAAFLRLQEIDPARDAAIVTRVKDAALQYLEVEHKLIVPSSVRELSIEELCLLASCDSGDQKYACTLLKVMHIIHHVDARRLRHRVSLSEARVAEMVVDKVDRFAITLSQTGFPLLRYEGGEKTFRSLVTKLLTKPEHHAAQIHDRVRFRFIAEDKADLLPLLVHMTHDLLPYNYIAPGKSINQLIDFAALQRSHAAYRDTSLDQTMSVQTDNEFSGSSYRSINFVADLPIRLSDEQLGVAKDSDLGRVIFNLAEIQIVDAATAEKNKAGDNSHHAYKARQIEVAHARITHQSPR